MTCESVVRPRRSHALHRRRGERVWSSAAGLAATAERIRRPLRPGRPRRPCRHPNPAGQGRSSRVALGDQAGQELGLVIRVVNVRL